MTSKLGFFGIVTVNAQAEVYLKYTGFELFYVKLYASKI